MISKFLLVLNFDRAINRNAILKVIKYGVFRKPRKKNRKNKKLI